MSPVAIVTASDSGIGQECAKELAEGGFDVGITYRSDEAGAKETLAAVAFLASEKGSYATGSSIIVDGGLTLMGAQLGAG